jgi:hypothetical protein
MYRSGRPKRFAAVLNRGWALIGKTELGPNRLATPKRVSQRRLSNGVRRTAAEARAVELDARLDEDRRTPSSTASRWSVPSATRDAT